MNSELSATATAEPGRRNIVAEKSFAFAVAIVGFARSLREAKHEYDLASQVLRSGTSIGANVCEALGGQSRSDFVHKLSIAAKEARETQYWLRLIRQTGLVAATQVDPLLDESSELLRILNSIILSTRQRTPQSTKRAGEPCDTHL